MPSISFIFPNPSQQVKLGFNICASFIAISNLFLPTTIDQCFDGNHLGNVMGIKDNDNNWNTSGHKERVVYVGENELLLFAKLFDGNSEWKMARLPVLHARQLVEVLERFEEQPITLGILADSKLVQL